MRSKAIDHDELIAAYVKSGKSHSEVMVFLLGGASGEDDPIQEEPTVTPKRRGRPRKTENSTEPFLKNEPHLFNDMRPELCVLRRIVGLGGIETGI